MAHHVSNLFKLNNLVKETNLEKVSLPELKEHYVRVKNFQKNRKLLESLPDKGDKYLNRLQKIEEIITRRCAELELKTDVKIDQQTKTEDLGDLLDKFQSILIEKRKVDETLSAEESQSKEEVTEVNVTIKDERSVEEMKQIESKSQDKTIKTVKKETEEVKNIAINYFARTESKKDTDIDQLKFKEVKERILKNMALKSTKAKSIPLQECYILLKEHEKRVQEFQIQQAANKLLEGKSNTYDYTFSKNIENLSYRDQKSELGDDYSDDEADSEDEDYFNDFYDDDDNNVDKIDRLHSHETAKQRFKLNDAL